MSTLSVIKKEHGAAYYARKLLRYLAKHREELNPLLILTHDYPDPDALASAFAFQYLLQRVYGIESKIGYGGVIGRTENRAMVKLLQIPVHKLKKQNVKRYRHVALVDTQPKFENNSFPANRRASLVIDQHPSVEKPATDLALIDTGCGATCVILAQALLLAAVEIPAKLATAIAYGILSDTLDLYRAKRPDVVHTYLSVLHRCDMRALAKIQNPTRSKVFFTALGRGIHQATAYRRLMVSHLGPVSSPEQVSEVADFLLTYERVNWAFCTGRYKGKLYLSLRTANANAQAGEVLRDLVANRNEAGGHGGVAGGICRLGNGASEEAWREMEQGLQARLAKRLRIPATGDFRKVFALPAESKKENHRNHVDKQPAGQEPQKPVQME